MVPPPLLATPYARFRSLTNRTLHPTREQTVTAISSFARPSSKREAAWGGESRFELPKPDCRLYGHRHRPASAVQALHSELHSDLGFRPVSSWAAGPVSTLIEHRKPALHQGAPKSQIFSQLSGLSAPALAACGGICSLT
ncbi:hypothetical protein TASIC1_0008034600 [Trichoderma asperellum]|uniref:Uncharacterized protein n=1 Tax=Trichoderma asperellum TaxID=101201 RepID=A0A6V8QZJ7_TRIAP|nr:hypothetical protein TASIC1_0008034600 [Trichoderma asperellum]